MLDILIAGWIALGGTADLAERYREELDARFPAWLSERGRGFRERIGAGGFGARRVREVLGADPGGAGADGSALGMPGGVLAVYDTAGRSISEVLWELAAKRRCGLDIELRRIPLRQETVEIAEVCGADPYKMACGGCAVLLAEAGEGEAVCARLRADGIPAQKVGRTAAGNGKLLRIGEDVRYLDRPRG